MPNDLKEELEVEAEFTAFYTGGEVKWLSDGTQILCQCESNIKSVNIATGSSEILTSHSEEDVEDDPIYTFSLSTSNVYIVTAHKSGLIKLWSREDGAVKKMWKNGHKGPVACLAFDTIDDFVASGGSDGIIRLWDTVHQTCIGSLRGALGVYSVLAFHPILEKQLIFGAADDTKIRSWNSRNGKEHLLFSGHFSKVTSLQFTADGNYMISSGRDRVIILWCLTEGKAIKTLPVYESIESVILLPDKFHIPNFKKKRETEGIFVACAGEKGVIKVWNIQAGRLMYEQTNSLVSAASEDGGLAVVHLLFNESRHFFAVVSSDHNIIIHELETFKCVKQMVGFSDEVLDVVFLGENDTHLVVATNSNDLKCYSLETMNCDILKGHTDIVLALDAFPTHPDSFVSSGKDNSVRVWKKNEINEVKCIAVGTRHTASVGSVYTARTTNNFFVSVSQDNCLKCWEMPNPVTMSDEAVKIKSTFTVPAHQMDINCVAISPNDKVIVTGSQDKTAKLFSAEDYSVVGVLRGHRRGIWCVRFSPVDQVILTSSADSTLKLWSLTELNCLKTFEGHDSSVLKAEFISRGMQIISSGADGLVKLWNIKSSECTFTMDKHDGKIWAMAIARNEGTVITGGSDSKLIKWRDVTAIRRETKAKEKEDMVLMEQELMNLLQNKKMVKALKLALRLNRPFQVYNIINEIIKDDNDKLRQTLKEINVTQKEMLLKCAAQWNTNTKHCLAAQVVFYILSPEILSGDLSVPGLGSFLEGAIPYTEKHFDRLTNLMQDLNFITYTMNCMQPHMS